MTFRILHRTLYMFLMCVYYCLRSSAKSHDLTNSILVRLIRTKNGFDGLNYDTQKNATWTLIYCGIFQMRPPFGAKAKLLICLFFSFLPTDFGRIVATTVSKCARAYFV